MTAAIYNDLQFTSLTQIEICSGEISTIFTSLTARYVSTVAGYISALIKKVQSWNISLHASRLHRSLLLSSSLRWSRCWRRRIRFVSSWWCPKIETFVIEWRLIWNLSYLSIVKLFDCVQCACSLSLWRVVSALFVRNPHKLLLVHAIRVQLNDARLIRCTFVFQNVNDLFLTIARVFVRAELRLPRQRLRLNDDKLLLLLCFLLLRVVKNYFHVFDFQL